MFKGFKQFIARGNVVDLAVGVVMGGAFGAVVSALVKDLVTPFISSIFKMPQFEKLAFTLNGSVFMYGDFINALISFLLISVTIYYFIVIPMNALLARLIKEPPVNPSTQKCPECLSEIPIEATRCSHCTIVLPK